MVVGSSKMAAKTAQYHVTSLEEQSDNSKTPIEISTTQPARWTLQLAYATAVCILGSSLQFGYNTSCINAPEQVRFQWAACNSYYVLIPTSV